MTAGILIEKIQRLINGSQFVTDRSRPSDNEIRSHINSVANKLLRLEVFESFQEESIPDGAMIATYEKVQVTRSTGFSSQVKLPITPMALPYRMGVFSVYPSGRPELEFIPVPTGIYNSLLKDVLNPIHRKVYEYHSGKIIIHDDLIGAGISQVDLRLCVLDVSLFSSTDPLPITPEIEDQIVREVVSLYVQQPIPRTESIQP